MNDATEAALAFILLLVLFIPTAFFNGWVMSTLWAWFVVPAFAAPALTVVQATGVMYVIQWLRIRPADSSDDHGPLYAVIKPVIVAVTVGLFALGFGWLLHAIIY